MKICPLCERSDVVWERTLDGIDLVRCTHCGLTYADMEDSSADLASSTYGDDHVQMYKTYQTLLDELWFRRIAVRFAPLLREGKVLDVGCGNGQLLSHFKSMGWECYGVDPSPYSKPFAEANGFRLFQTKIEDCSPEIGKFDLVVSSSTLEHIARPLAHVEAILRVLNTNGIAYFCGIPNYGSILVRLGISDFYMNTPPGHVNYFTSETLLRLFASAGVAPQSVLVRSYGIPGTHEIYNRITRLFRAGHGVAETKMSGFDHQEKAGRGAQDDKMQYVKRKLGQMLVSGFYHVGRLGGLGDKLEATVVNNCSGVH